MPSPATPEQQFATLREIAQKAVLNNPEVVAKWHNFKASVEEIGVASGGYLPRVDLIAGSRPRVPQTAAFQRLEGRRKKATTTATAGW